MPSEGAASIIGYALGELVKYYNLANAIMKRLTRVIDRAALTTIMSGVTLQMDRWRIPAPRSRPWKRPSTIRP